MTDVWFISEATEFKKRKRIGIFSQTSFLHSYFYIVVIKSTENLQNKGHPHTLWKRKQSLSQPFATGFVLASSSLQLYLQFYFYFSPDRQTECNLPTTGYCQTARSPFVSIFCSDDQRPDHKINSNNQVASLLKKSPTQLIL